MCACTRISVVLVFKIHWIVQALCIGLYGFVDWLMNKDFIMKFHNLLNVNFCCSIQVI